MLTQETQCDTCASASDANPCTDHCRFIHVLFIEDNETDYLMLQKHFEKMQGPRRYKLDWAATYREGYGKLRDNKYDLVFVDYVLDEGNGIALIDDLDSAKVYPPFILMTHYDDYRYYDDSLEAGFYDYLIKSEVTPSLLDRAALYAMERKKVEMRLSFERQCFLYALERLPYAILRTDKTFRIKSVNKRALEMFGQKEQEMSGTNVFDFIETPHKAEIIDQFFVSDHQAISFTSVWQSEAQKGSHLAEKTLMWDCLYRDFETEKGFLFIGKDVTDQLRIEPSEDETPESLDAALSKAARGFGNKS